MWIGTISDGRGSRAPALSPFALSSYPPIALSAVSPYLSPMPRLLIVANRLPITVSATEGGVEVQRSTGGLATGLMRPHEQSDGLWIGWSGVPADLDAEQQAALDRELAAMRLVAVPLSADLVSRFYEGYSNGVLWPLFHY